jgi:hypothetical protein
MRFVTIHHPQLDPAVVPETALAHYTGHGWTVAEPDPPAPSHMDEPEPAAEGAAVDQPGDTAAASAPRKTARSSKES